MTKLETTAEERKAWLIRADDAGRLARDLDKAFIPESWVQDYVDQLLRVAKKFDPGSAMRAATLLRVEHALDMVKAYRERPKG